MNDDIETISQRLKQPDNLLPDEASNFLVKLSSLLSTQNVIRSQKLFLLNLKKRDLIKEFKTAAKAKVFAEASEEWMEWKKADDTGKAAEELIKSLKYHIRNEQLERQNSKY